MLETPKSSLGIFWTFHEVEEDGSEQIYQDEVSGFIIFGFGWSRTPSAAEICAIEKFWPSGSIELRPQIFDAEEYLLVSADIYVKRWPPPEMWHGLLENSLKYFVTVGAKVSWCGTESSFSWPGLFEPGQMQDGIYAAYSESTGYLCHAGLDEPISFLSEAEVERLTFLVNKSVLAKQANRRTDEL